MDELLEEVVIRVHDKTDIECIGVGLEPIGDYEAQVIRKCGIMAQAIGQELGYQFDEEKSVKLLAHMSHLALIKLSEELERKNDNKSVGSVSPENAEN